MFARVALLMSMFGLASAWWCTGHAIVAAVASRHLAPGVQDAANDLISYLAKDYPQSPNFLNSACWADDLKTQDVEQMANNHFVNLPYTRGAVYSEIPAATNDTGVIWAINLASQTLTSNLSHTIDKARQLRFIIHFIGDIHQPLHTATLYSREFPTGDQGGNLYLIKGAYTALHPFYDSGAGLWGSTEPRPFPQNSTDFIESWASKVEAQYPPSYFGNDVNETDPAIWADENLSNLIPFVYSTPQGQVPSDTYTGQAQTLCQKQVALAGYRLANYLNTIFA
jgi:hypothetical protein